MDPDRLLAAGAGLCRLGQGHAHDRIVVLLADVEVAVTVQSQVVGRLEARTNNCGNARRVDSCDGSARVIRYVDVVLVVYSDPDRSFEVGARAEDAAAAVGADAVDAVGRKIGDVQVPCAVKSQT